jgi:hypothetical protein
MPRTLRSDSAPAEKSPLGTPQVYPARVADLDKASVDGGALVVTRRTAIALGGAAFITLGGPALALAGQQSSATSVWSRASYTPLVGDPFSVAGMSGSLRLVGVEDLPGAPAGSDQAFALTFRAPAAIDALPGDPPVLRHPTLGSFPLFLESGGDRSFTAVINRLYG